MSEPERWIVVTGWERHQHRDMARTRVPPWLKVYTGLLSDEDYLRLSPNRRAILVGLWLSYAITRRELRENTASISRRLAQKVTSRDLDALNRAGFITFSDSKPASNYASKPASLEVEIEKNTKAVTSKANAAANGLDSEKTLELSKIIEQLRGVDDRTWNTLQPLAASVPRSVLADLRTRCTGKGPGWVVRALQSEMKARLGAA